MKRHSTDLVSLAFGLIFAGIAGWWLIGNYVLDLNIRVPNLGLIIAGGLILLGLLGAIGSLRRDRRTEQRDSDVDTPSETRAPATVMAGMPTVGDPRSMPTVISNPYLTKPDLEADPDERTDAVDADTVIQARTDTRDDPTYENPRDTTYEIPRDTPYESPSDTPYEIPRDVTSDRAAGDATSNAEPGEAASDREPDASSDRGPGDGTTYDGAAGPTDSEPNESVDPAAPSERDNRPS